MLAADPLAAERLADGLRAAERAALVLRAPPEPDLARDDAGLLLADERGRDALALLLGPDLELARERDAESAMVTPPGFG
ncbi:MAG: hypothetical protein ACTHOE_01185 [Conexibacter sp.]